MAAFENVAKWDPGVARAERVGNGPVGLGTVFHVVSVFNGREIPLDYEITAFEPPNRVVLKAQTPTLRSVDEIKVDATGTSSLMTYNANLTFKGALWFANPILVLSFKKIGDRARDGLRRELNK
jgi:hypothetical protein